MCIRDRDIKANMTGALKAILERFPKLLRRVWSTLKVTTVVFSNKAWSIFSRMSSLSDLVNIKTLFRAAYCVFNLQIFTINLCPPTDFPFN